MNAYRMNRFVRRAVVAALWLLGKAALASGGPAAQAQDTTPIIVTPPTEGIITPPTRPRPRRRARCMTSASARSMAAFISPG